MDGYVLPGAYGLRNRAVLCLYSRSPVVCIKKSFPARTAGEQKGWDSSTHIPVLCPILNYTLSIKYRVWGINTFRPYQVLPGLPEPAP